MTISNASNRPLNALAGSVPDVSGALLDYLQPMTFTTIVKTVENFQVVETPTSVSFQGVWQPFTARQIQMKPEGQRAWKWFMVHALVALPLVPDDVVTYLGTQYRVKADNDYSIYGYYQYELIEDYTGAGP